MAIELNLPHPLEEIKNAFDQCDEKLGNFKALNNMCYLAGINELVEDLRKDCRLDAGLAKELEKLRSQVVGVTFTLKKFSQTK